jgi:hypothetical protein
MDAIYDWVAAVVAEEGRTDPIVWNYGDGPRPKTPFVSLEFIGTSTPGMPDYSLVEITPEHPNGVQTITRPVRRALTMYAFGEGALDLLETIKASYEKDLYIAMLSKQGLVIPDALEVRENPTVRDGTDTESSALFEFYVTYMRVIEDDSAGYISTVHIQPPDNIPMEEITNEEE